MGEGRTGMGEARTGTGTGMGEARTDIGTGMEEARMGMAEVVGARMDKGTAAVVVGKAAGMVAAEVGAKTSTRRW